MFTKRSIIHFLISVAIAFIIAFSIRMFIMDFVLVKGVSMEPTLESGDKSIAFKTLTPKTGDVIMMNAGEHNVIKRLIATEGDTIEIHENKLFINKKKIKEPYIKERMNTNDMEAYTLQKDEMFVMGDNRNMSSDSRSYGVHSSDEYIGKALFYIRGGKFGKTS